MSFTSTNYNNTIPSSEGQKSYKCLIMILGESYDENKL